MISVNNVAKFSILILLSYIFAGSCANTSAPPMGGPKDTIPPRILRVMPDSGMVGFPVKGGSITLTFDEYTILKEEQKNIFLSPPQLKRPLSKIRGKSITISFAEPLDSAKTYTLNFGRSIQDNNEGNQFYEYVYPFSTGKVLDTMMVSGRVSLADNLMPAKNMIIAFYDNKPDSAIYTQLPSAIAKSDIFGYFTVRNLKHTQYAVYAFEDVNLNYKYDPENERIAFLDTLYTPVKPLVSNMPELTFVGEKDTLAAMSRPADLELYMFKEDNERQFIKDSKREQHRMAFLTFSASYPIIDSIEIAGLKESSFRKETNIRRDSLLLWITDTTIIAPDSLKIKITYHKTDSAGVLSPFTENIVLAPPRKPQENKEEQEVLQRSSKDKKRKDLLEFKVDSDPALFEQNGFSLVFEAPLSDLNRDSISLIYKAPRGDMGKMEYQVIYDSLWSRIVNIKPVGRLLPGYQYSLDIPAFAIKDIYKRTNDSIINTVSLPSDEKLSKLTLDIKGTKGNYIVELTNITRDKVFRSFRISNDTILEFPYLAKGKYSIKITEDLNNNGVIDTGNLKKRQQPEKVRLYSLADGNTIINIPESVELLQLVNIDEIFNPVKK